MQSFFHWGLDFYRPPLTHPTTRPPRASTSCQLRTRVREGISRHPLSYQRVGFMRAWVLGQPVQYYRFFPEYQRHAFKLILWVRSS